MQLSKYMSRGMYIKLKKMMLKKRVNKFKDYISRNSVYRNIHNGERCFILGNGPSLKNVDFTLLENEYTFTVNQAPRDPRFSELKTNYHLWSDRRFFRLDDSKDEDMELLSVMRSVYKKSPNVKIFYEIEALDIVNKFKLNAHGECNFFQIEFLNPRKMEKGLIDFSDVVCNYPTVVDFGIILAVYMGFKEIYLLGCDCTSILNLVQNKIDSAKNNAYSYNMSQNDTKFMEKLAKQSTILEDLKSQVELFESYEALNIYCNKNGVKLYNATEGGVLECIQRVNLSDVLKNDVR